MSENQPSTQSSSPPDGQNAERESNENRLLVHASEKEAQDTCSMLGKARIDCVVLSSIDDLCAEVARGAGAVLVAEEELAKAQTLAALAGCIARQPAWSDLPIVILTDCDEATSQVIERAMEALQAPILVERPLRAGLLTSTLRAALRGRERQYQIRDYLAERARNQTTRTHQADLLEQTHDALKRSEADLNDFFDNAAIGLHWVGPDGIIQRVNQSELDLLGYTREEYVGHHIAEFHVSQPVVDDILARLARGEKLDKYSAQMRCKDGTAKDVEIVSSVLWEDGRFVHTRCFTLDVTERKRAERMLEERTALLRAISTATTDLIFVKDLDGRLVMGNPAFFKLLGPEATVIGKTDLEIHADREQAQRIIDNDRHVMSTAQTETFEERVGPQDAVATLLSTKSPYRDENGKIVGVVGISRDISERKRMEEALRASEHLYRGIGESIDYGVWVCDRDGRDIYTSESFLRLIGLSQKDYADAGWTQVVHPEDAERALEAWDNCVTKGEAVDVELRFKGVEGEYHPVLVRGVPVRNDEGGIICWAGINLDISRLKAAEDSLREADRRKDEFLASLAHELRNPLAPISNALQLLHLRTPTKAESDWARNVIERQVKQLTRLIDDLLDLSRITRGKVTLRKQRIYLATVIHDAVETSRPIMETSSHQFSLVLPDKPLTIEADPLRLAQVLANLLNNAAKYTYPGGRITLSAASEGNHVVIRVKDTGIGIAPEMLPRIFDMFIQADKTLERVQGGLGIGLTLVRLFVNMHGGTVEALSPGLGKGSEFIVRLPIGNIKRPPAELPRARATTSPASASRKLRIVVVDDNRDSVESMLLLLDMWGHEVRAAYDGAQGVKAVSEFKPDVVLLDIGLPEVNGYDVARSIRELAGNHKLMLIAVTGWGQEDDRRKSHAAGFDHHLVKPVDLNVLQELLAAASPQSAHN